MAKKKSNGTVNTADYRHTGEKRTNIPPAKIAAEGKVPRVREVRYQYSPHLPPKLQFDPTGASDKLPELLQEAQRRALTAAETRQLAEALRTQEPWLEWAAKREKRDFEVDPLALQIHERISAKAILRVAAREDLERSLFADPQQLYHEAIQFYQHDIDWTNRLILGDSLQVMTSLSRRENLAGKIQMIYMDPPYGIKFASNFQPEVGKRNVRDKEQDLTREPEMVKAYRDTWYLGIHSYLTYLRDRLVVAKELLHDSGSIFVQISDKNLHRVRNVLDEVFLPENFVSVITVKKTGGMGEELIDNVSDYLLWYCKDRNRIKYRRLYKPKDLQEGVGERYSRVELPDGSIRPLTDDEAENPLSLPPGSRIFLGGPMTSQTASESTTFDFDFEGRLIKLRKGGWKTNTQGMKRLINADRLLPTRDFVNYKIGFDDFPAVSVGNLWADTMGTAEQNKVYVVQTTTKVIQRCLLMTTDPGDLVLDPTCGSGTTAYVAEQWGRRWITVDTSRVSIAIARQRLMTATFDMYALRDESVGVSGSFKYKTIPHITLKSIARNTNLDPIFTKHQPLLDNALEVCNTALKQVGDAAREKLRGKLLRKQKDEGRKAITDADRRRWELHEKGKGWEHWQVPFDTDPDWPKALADAVKEYRKARRTKMDEVNACIAANAEQEELVDQPEVVKGILRVSGPFTVEGVRPEEVSLGGDGLFSSAVEETVLASPSGEDDSQNIRAYLSQMVGYLRTDGLTFLGNQHKKFARLEALFEDSSASLIHAEGSWEGTDSRTRNAVAISFGPQHGPVTAMQVEEAIRAAKQYDDLVLAGFSFDAEAFAVVHEQNHPKLRIHLAHIRPDLNEAMNGLLKDTVNSELFAVFGQPEIDVRESNKGWICTLKGVDIYNPLDNTVRSSGADKVAAWFLDGDFDGRCFCITQAFFPDQDAWEKIAKALGAGADLEAFEQLKGTSSLPFAKGKFGRIAVKVIDPRGNEVMAIRKLS